MIHPSLFACWALALTASAALADPDGFWRLEFEDTFTAPTINTSSWRVLDNFTHGDREWELYTSDNVYIEGGSLVLRTQARDIMHGSKQYHFASGWVDTLGLVDFTYGKVEARIRLPQELPGLWPAWWLVDDNHHCWPTGGEIDILEAVGGFRDDGIFGTYHWGSQCGADAWTKDGDRNGLSPRPAGGHFSDEYHNFTVYFNASVMTWAVDGKPFVSRVAGQPSGLFVPSWPLYGILNTALSYWAGPQPPPRDGYPAFMYVDAVRSWSWAGATGNATSGAFPIPFNATGLQPQLAAAQAAPGWRGGAAAVVTAASEPRS